MRHADLRQAGESEERITAVATRRDATFFTPAALIAKPIPGRPPGQNYSE
ncbi:hypothetical protein [Nonomuraea diastatica]|nr:hypothetical protein [Nonomuraea diastatica]